MCCGVAQTPRKWVAVAHPSRPARRRHVTWEHQAEIAEDLEFLCLVAIGLNVYEKSLLLAM
jgi:hypothetical protein